MFKIGRVPNVRGWQRTRWVGKPYGKKRSNKLYKPCEREQKFEMTHFYSLLGSLTSHLFGRNIGYNGVLICLFILICFIHDYK